MYKCIFRIASGNNTNKSESDQEDNDDVNDNDWSYGAEKKGETVTPFLAIFWIIAKPLEGLHCINSDCNYLSISLRVYAF